MAQQTDMPLHELRAYKPELTKPEDFDEFWDRSLEELALTPIEYSLARVAYPSRRAELFKVSFTGFKGAAIEGWLAIPAGERKLPGIVTYHGYNWSPDGDIHETVNLCLQGYAVLHMSTRGQQGESSDNVISPHGSIAGWLTKGIQHPEHYYFRGVFMDAVRAVEVLSAIPEVDSGRIAVAGASQGGGIALAAAAFSPIPVVACADYPGFTNFERVIDTADTMPYQELNEYFRRYSDPAIEQQARKTLAYHDIMNIGTRIRCHTFMTVGLVDNITPPSTIFAAYNHLNCSKEISVHRYHGHEFIPGAHRRKLETLLERLY
ncbi:acetylxylan esterase [Paenibacillus sp. NPDC058174]|uniref:acetylxylan esterase n=1 Tax=Paenibacillus sp. NPDC058174 TaxID=3346366 RepID=UPI0036DA3EA9